VAYNPNGVDIANQNAIVCPEAHVYYAIPGAQQWYRADLVVRNLLLNNNILISSRPLIVYEGKGAGGDTWQGVRRQIENWCIQSVLRNSAQDVAVGRPCWCIGARGKDVRFWLYSAQLADPKNNVSGMKPIKFNKDDVVNPIYVDQTAPADDVDTLEVQHNWQLCHDVINFLLANHPHQGAMADNF
jgi:hypothetical protein